MQPPSTRASRAAKRAAREEDDEPTPRRVRHNPIVCTIVRCSDNHNDWCQYFMGPRDGPQQLLKADIGKDLTIFHEGPPGEERVVRMWWRDVAVVEHYEGAKGAERKVRIDLPNGGTQHFAGPKGAERYVCTSYPDGWVHRLEGFFQPVVGTPVPSVP